ncbi:MAG: mandelate racemase/muconate lactonizing enzyme family protein [Chloroflexia bacterium]
MTDVRPWIVAGPPTDATSGPAAHLQQYIFVQVDTDEGLTGWGEVTSYPGMVANRAVAAMVREVRDTLVGQDPSQIEAIWHKLFRLFTYMGTRGATTALISGIDIALWDIRGQALGQPIYELLGGKVRETIPLYVHFAPDITPEGMAANAKEQVDLGAKGIKTDPFLAAGRARGILNNNVYINGELDPATEQLGVDMIAAIREAIGPQVELLIDAHAIFNVPTAVRLATRLAEYTIHWFEEPVPPESYHALQQVREQVPTRICVGERLHTRFEFVPIFEQRLADYVMPDVTWTGGISELKKIATMAEAYYIPVSPHDASGPVNIMAGAHVSMTIPNFYKLEARRAQFSFYNAFIKEPLEVRDGNLIVSNRPGLGVSLDLDYLRAHEVR